MSAAASGLVDSGRTGDVLLFLQGHFSLFVSVFQAGFLDVLSGPHRYLLCA